MLVLFANISIGDGGKGAAVSPLKLGRNPFRANFLKNNRKFGQKVYSPPKKRI